MCKNNERFTPFHFSPLYAVFISFPLSLTCGYQAFDYTCFVVINYYQIIITCCYVLRNNKREVISNIRKYQINKYICVHNVYTKL